jgi:hypothetical protein
MNGFNKLVSVDLLSGKGSGSLDLDLSKLIPSGKALVVQFVSTRAEMPPGQKPDPVIVVLDKNGSAVVQHYAVTHLQLQYGGSDIYTSAHAMELVLTRDLKLRADMLRDTTNGTAHCFFGISGHLVEA